MLRFRGTSSVPANEEFVPTGQRFDAPGGRSLDALLMFGKILKDLYRLTQSTLKLPVSKELPPNWPSCLPQKDGQAFLSANAHQTGR
jgi:hypothetical protein